ncbi:MAG: hypothetical protein ACI9H8_001528 [Lysobacterales bacterium]|jgi:hypothetical protein
MNNVANVSGSCFCGAVRFNFEFPSIWCSHCHCSMCRKVHGAGYVTWVGFDNTYFHLEKGKQELSWFESSPGASRGFCSKCSSSMFFRSEQWPGELHVALACLDGPVDRQPKTNAYHNSHVDWMPLDDALKAFNP